MDPKSSFAKAEIASAQYSLKLNVKDCLWSPAAVACRRTVPHCDPTDAAEHANKSSGACFKWLLKITLHLKYTKDYF